MKKRERLARAAAISNGMVWFGLSVFLGIFAVQLAPAPFAGQWYTIAGWALSLSPRSASSSWPRLNSA